MYVGYTHLAGYSCRERMGGFILFEYNVNWKFKRASLNEFAISSRIKLVDY